MDSTDLQPPTQLDSTFGCLFLSAIFTCVLWGIGCLQLYLYYEKYWKKDRIWLKVYILVIWILDTAHQVLVVEVMYVSFVKGMTDPELLILVQRPIVHCAILTAFIDTMVQAIFVRRAWYISNKSRLLVAILSAFVLAQFVATIAYYAEIFHYIQLEQFLEAVPTELAMNACMALTDAAIAVAIIWLLRKSRSGITRTDSIVNRLMMYTVGSGLVTAVVMILALISVSVAPNALMYLLADLVVPKLYFNCMLASLNARSSLQKFQESSSGGISFRLAGLSSNTTEVSNSSAGISDKVPGQRPIECRVNIEMESVSNEQKKLDRLSSHESRATATNISNV